MDAMPRGEPHVQLVHGGSPPLREAGQSYAFLNHSPLTLPNNLPPSVDNKPLARQKRRRTRPEDQAILESAYQRDPKPDRTARLELVKQVALGEKEVQIWFQNRRQSSRRKSRPLLPHEIAQYQKSRSIYCSPALPTSSILDSHSSDDASGQEHDSSASPRAEALRDGRLDHEACPQPSGEDRRDSIGISSIISRAEFDTSDKPAIDTVTPEAYHPSPVGYVANRRNAAAVDREKVLQHVESRERLVDGVHDQEQPAKGSASFVRLSMTSDGNATVVTKDSTKPSPVRSSQTMQASVDSSKVTSSDTPSAVLPPPKLLARSASGRSHDSRTWAFWCDKHARSELEEKAEKDGRSSAIDAIGLIRSNSTRQALGIMSSKRNAVVGQHQASIKRPKLGHERPALQRSQTSQGRLQGEAVGQGAKPKLKCTESAGAVYIHGNDSDKENRSPERGPRALAISEMGIMPANRSDLRAHSRSDENANLDGDAEVAAFMRGGGRTMSSVTESDDMDCVQGLLSLSQGAWK